LPATLVDVADMAEVSTATASRALRGLAGVAPETRARVLAAADELHYVAHPQASRLAAGRTHTVGVVVPRLGQWYYASLLEAIHSLVGAAAYDLLPFALRDREARERFLARLPFRKRVDGLIVVDVPMTDEQLASMAAVDVPIVTVGLRTDTFSSLTVDNRGGARMATEHLLGLGHERIGLIGGSQHEPFDFPIPHARREGFELAMAARDLSLCDQWIVDAELDAAGGVRAMTRVLSSDARPTGVVCMSDEMAFGAMQVLRDLGLRVPEDVSLVGFDDHEVSPYIGLTTVGQDVAAQGRAAAGWMLEALLGSHEHHHEVLPTRLLVRRSTSACPRP